MALVLHNYCRRRRPHDLHNTISRHVSLFWRGVLKASMALASDIQIEVGDGYSTRKYWLDHWVGNDTFVFKLLIYLCLHWIHPQRGTPKLAYLMKEWFELPNLKDEHAKTCLMISTISLPSNLNISPLHRMFDNGSLNKMVSSPSSFYISLTGYLGENNCFWWI